MNISRSGKWIVGIAAGIGTIIATAKTLHEIAANLNGWHVLLALSLLVLIALGIDTSHTWAKKQFDALGVRLDTEAATRANAIESLSKQVAEAVRRIEDSIRTFKPVADIETGINGPRLVATHYGRAEDAPLQIGNIWYSEGKPISTRDVLLGKHLNKNGLWVICETDDAALDISAGNVPVGRSTLKFEDYELPRLAKPNLPGFFEATIERPNGASLMGGGLRDVMIEEDVSEITVPITYKDSREQWYLSPAKIQRDWKGLSVRPQPRQKISQPKP
jgi:hypothetical protein